MESLFALECRFLAKRGMASFSIEPCAEASVTSTASEVVRLVAVLACVIMLRRRRGLRLSATAAALQAGLVFWLERGSTELAQALARLAWTAIACFPESPLLQLACLAALCAIQPQYAWLLPLVAWQPNALFSKSDPRSAQHRAVLSGLLLRYLYLSILAALALVGAAMSSSLWPSMTLSPLASWMIPAPLFASSPSGIASPSSGVLWYLHTMILPEHSVYFSVLIAVQPALAALFLASVLLPFDSPPLMELVFVVFQIYQSRPDVAGIGLMLVALLAREEGQVAAAMRHLSWILLAIAVPVLVSPVMRHLWLHWGTGNANFLFFQGYAQWVSLVLFVLEYVSAYLKLKQGE